MSTEIQNDTQVSDVQVTGVDQSTVKAIKAEKAKKVGAKPSKKEQAAAAAPVAPNFNIYLADENMPVTLVPITELVSLDATPIKGAKRAMRELDDENLFRVQSAIEAGTLKEAIEVVPTSMGLVVVDGNHRWAAYVQIVKNLITKGDPTLTPDQIDAKLASVIAEYQVPVTFKQARSEWDVLELAYTANFKHGMGVSSGSRSRYAIELMKHMAELGTPISQHQAARIAGLANHTAISRQLGRDLEAEKKAGREAKMRDMLISDDVQEIEQLTALDRAEKASKFNPTQDNKHMNAILAAAKYFDEHTLSMTDLETLVASYGKQANEGQVGILQIIADALTRSQIKAGDPKQGALTLTATEKAGLEYIGPNGL